MADETFGSTVEFIETKSLYETGTYLLRLTKWEVKIGEFPTDDDPKIKETKSFFWFTFNEENAEGEVVGEYLFRCAPMFGGKSKSFPAIVRGLLGKTLKDKLNEREVRSLTPKNYYGRLYEVMLIVDEYRGKAFNDIVSMKEVEGVVKLK